MHKPLSEWLMYTYMQELSTLLKKGLYSQYNRVEEERTFIRGQIHTAKQIRQPTHRQHLTHVRHSIFSINRPENRLLRTALQYCRMTTQDNENWTLASSLEGMMHHVPASFHIKNDLAEWQHARHMTQYASIKPWCELILQKNIPTALQDVWQGMSLLFPMEKVFESFVVHSLRQRLAKDIKLTTQSSRKSLCIHKNKNMFALKPDILLEGKEKTWIADAKWKCLTSTHDAENKYGLSQADMYQLFTYGHKYLHGNGTMALIFPKTESFLGLEFPFFFTDDLILYVLACDLENDELFPSSSLCHFPLR